MPVARYQGDSTIGDPDYDEYGRPIDPATGLPDPDPFGNTGGYVPPSGSGSPSGSGRSGVVSPVDVADPKEVNQGAGKDILGDLGLGATDEELNAIREAKTQRARVNALGDTIPGVLDASVIDPFKDLQAYQTGDPLDLSAAKNDLYDPRTGKTRSSYADLDFVGPEMQGRDAQMRSLGVRKSGGRST